MSQSEHGWGADCRCHVDVLDLPTTTHCKKNLSFPVANRLSDDEYRRLCKVWLVLGQDIHDDATPRTSHVSMNPRLHMLDWSEDDLDIFATTLS